MARDIVTAKELVEIIAARLPLAFPAGVVTVAENTETAALRLLLPNGQKFRVEAKRLNEEAGS